MATREETDSLMLHAMLEGIAVSTVVRMMRDIIPNQLSLTLDVALIVNRSHGWVKELKILGSLGEGLVHFTIFTGNESDSDIMLVSENSLVYEHRFVEVPVSTWLFQMQSCNTNSGYVRLRLKKQGNVRLFNPDLFDIKSLFEYDTTSDCNYLSNVMNQHFVNLLQNVAIPYPNLKVRDITDVVDSGPCVTCKSPFTVPRIGIPGDLDLVTGLWCPEWPSVAVEWILRDRFNGWPSREFIDLQVPRGCYVIPVGCKECTKTHLDWRISFAHIEQALVHSLNAKQINCLLLLRQLKKFFFEVKMPNVITSYIIKTTLFWTIEETSPELWQSHKLLTAVKLCLNKLITFIQNDYCPHFFIRTCNLLIRRYSQGDKCSVLQICLEARRNPMIILCRTPPFSEESRLCRSNPLLSSEYSGQEILDLESDMMVKLMTSNLFHFLPFTVNIMFQIKLSDLDSKQEVLQYCKSVAQETIVLFSNRTHACRQEVEIIKKYIHGITQRLIWSLEVGNVSPNQVEYTYDNTTDADDVNCIANTCHLHVIVGNYSRCYDILVKFVAAQKHGVYKRLINIDTILSGGEFYFTYAMINVLLAVTDDKMSCISDLIFLQMEGDTLPTPLQTELNPILIGKPDVDTLPGRKPTVLVDPLVYVCFLKFWCSMKMDQNISKLMARDDMVWCCGLINIEEKAVALNLLAFCHRQLGEYEQAFVVLCRAFSERPLKCSTLIHIATLVNNKLKGPFG